MKSNSSNPLISVIIPVYNSRKYLSAAIKSILNQTEKNFELLAIDDGSTDGSWQLLQKLSKKDKRIQIFRQEKNEGLVKCLNYLIPKTKGKYVARMDADDVSLPTRFAKQVDYLEKNKNVVACGGQEEIINTEGKIIADKFFPVTHETCYKMIFNIMVIQPPLLMARGKIIRKLRYDNKIFKNDDISMHFKLLQKGDFGNVDDIIFQYRQLDNSLTHKNPKRVYFLALLVRLNAIWKYNYRPQFTNIIISIIETIVVGLLPTNMLIKLFEFLRYAKLNKVKPLMQLKLLFANS